MVKKASIISVFIASPNDVQKERKIAVEVINEINLQLNRESNILLRPVMWETHCRPSIGVDQQDVINDQIGKYDIFVGIMWKRFGTPTHRAESGTEEEFQRALSSYIQNRSPKIMFYFKQANIPPINPDELKQTVNVLDFNRKLKEIGILPFTYKTNNEFQKLLTRHLTEEARNIRIAYQKKSTFTPLLPSSYFQDLFKMFEMFISSFEQLIRDFDRELKGKIAIFAADFSEIHDYMYYYRINADRSQINRYIFDNINNPITLMPGAVGELSTDLERALPSIEVLRRNPLDEFEDVKIFVNEFQNVLNNDKRLIELYGRAEKQMLNAWGELFNIVVQGENTTALAQIKKLLDNNRISPIDGIGQLTNNLTSDVRRRKNWVFNELNNSRPDKYRNNKIDAIDFAITWMLNSSNDYHSRGKEAYITIYSQSRALQSACKSGTDLQWDDDYLVRNAHYLKIRTKLQKEFNSIIEQKTFVSFWLQKCKELQNDLKQLKSISVNFSKPVKSSNKLIEKFIIFEEECYRRLEISEISDETTQKEKIDRAKRLYNQIKKGEGFFGKPEEAMTILKCHLNAINSKFKLFLPEEFTAKSDKISAARIAKWISEEI